MEVLEQPTLVLNRRWSPVHVTTVERALVLLWTDAARAVDPEDFQLHGWDAWTRLVPAEDAPCVRTARLRLRVPEVLCLARFDRMPAVGVAFSRRNVARRDHHTCQYCGSRPGGDRITVDHVIPRAQGGPSTWTNCVAACVACNALKADRTPEQAGLRLRRPPLRPDWRPFYAARGRKLASWAKFLGPEPATAMA